MNSEYITPEVEILEMKTEQVFASSGEGWTYDDYEEYGL